MQKAFEGGKNYSPLVLGLPGSVPEEDRSSESPNQIGRIAKSLLELQNNLRSQKWFGRGGKSKTKEKEALGRQKPAWCNTEFFWRFRQL
eukprot:Gb_22619 [translate_table: standard]